MTSLLVLYGSQTGCAQEAAERIATEGRNRAFAVRIAVMDEYDKAGLPDEPFVVFVASTSGDGDVPDNMAAFWRFLLRASLPGDVLASVRFAVFGLGDSSYAKFNAASRKLHARLLQLGAVPVCDRGLGDDQSSLGVDGDLDAWLSVLWPAALSTWPPPPGHVIDDAPKPCVPSVSAQPAQDGAGVTGPVPDPSLFPPPRGVYSPCVCATLISNNRMTSSDWEQDVRSIRLDVSSAPVRYAAGDVAVVMCGNDGDGGVMVESLCKRVCVAADEVYVIAAVGLPPRATPRQLFTHYVDILSVPRRSILQQLAFYASDAEQKEKLFEMATTAGTDIYHSYCRREKRCIVEVLEDFHSVTVPLHALLSLLPRMQPRAYSIASAPDAAPGVLELCVGVVRYTTPFKRTKWGTCSSWLASRAPGSSVCVWFKRGLISSPPPSVPLVLIGPGTGVAPMRSLLQHRLAHATPEKRDVMPLHPLSSVAIVEHEAKDHLYGEEWPAYPTDVLTYHVAFSRDQKDKVYVQHRIVECGAAVCDVLLTRGGTVFIAGSAKQMPTDVTNAIKLVFVAAGGLSEGEATAAIAALIKAKRLVIEAWS